MTTSLATLWFRENAGAFSGQLSFDEPLSRHTYYRIGGPAQVFAVPRSIEDLHWLAEGLRNTGSPFFVLGAGSNLLVSDEGFQGLVIRAGRINLEVLAVPSRETAAGAAPGQPIRLRTGASVANSSLLRRAVQEGWGGLEFLTGVPGSVGGAVMMNAGTHLGETRDRLKKVEIFPLVGASGGEGYLPECFEGDQLKFQYRKNLFLPPGSFIWAAEWEVTAVDPATLKGRIDETLARRKATQPVDLPSCGSVFKNPREAGLSAWQVVDKLGLRGHQLGGAQFAEKHSNFIVNLGGARASDVRGLIELAKNRALQELGVHLEEEVIYLG